MTPNTRRLCQRNRVFRQRKLTTEALFKGEIGFWTGVHWMEVNLPRKHPWDQIAFKHDDPQARS